MYKILKKISLNSNVDMMEIHAPYVAKKAEAGQFIILRVCNDGERIPLTIADYNRTKGSVTIIFQKVGKTTKLLGNLKEGETILDFAGPLGNMSPLDGFKNVAVIGGGLGSAIAFPQIKKLSSLNSKVDAILGFRNKDLIILEDEIKKYTTNIYITTDDGSNGNKGFVSDILEKLINEGKKYDLVIAIGPLIMMKVISNITNKYNIKTLVSMNPIMVDGTGMCGGCRVTVGGEVKFACIDGPDFDGHKIDFDEAMRRQLMYKKEESTSNNHTCKLEEKYEN
jgi:ferredoxin--NADP+ reductase